MSRLLVYQTLHVLAFAQSDLQSHLPDSLLHVLNFRHSEYWIPQCDVFLTLIPSDALSAAPEGILSQMCSTLSYGI